MYLDDLKQIKISVNNALVELNELIKSEDIYAQVVQLIKEETILKEIKTLIEQI